MGIEFNFWNFALRHLTYGFIIIRIIDIFLFYPYPLAYFSTFNIKTEFIREANPILARPQWGESLQKRWNGYKNS